MSADTDLGGWIHTASGKKWYLAAPRWQDVDIHDIALHLSRICRFTGACSRFYSVAEHSYWVSYVVPPRMAMAGLLHDAHEAYVGDCSRPLKQLLPDYKYIEGLNWQAVSKAFGLPWELPPEVKAADNAMLLTERKALMQGLSEPWAIDGAPAKITIECWHHEWAAKRFLDRFEQLMS